MKIGIIGGGASGMTAAIAAARCGAEVTIFEKNNRVGKKILVTGNGKCNLSNLNFSYDCYHSEDKQKLIAVMEQFGVNDTLDFFHRLGLMTKEKNGYLYPQCEQASAVLDLLRFSLTRLGVTIRTDCFVKKIEKKRERFLLHIQKEDRHISCEFDRIILACGSKAGLKKGEEENGQKLAAAFGLRRTAFVPALVQLRCRETFFKALAGVRTGAEVTLSIKGKEYREKGELQLTDYGISGILVFQLSRYAARALPELKEISGSINFLPEFSDTEWERFLLERKKSLGMESGELFFTGTVHKKIISVILKEAGFPVQVPVAELSDEKLLEAGRLFRHFPVTINGVNPFAQAQVCAGGVLLSEMTEKLEAKTVKGLYLAGEMLDVDGKCGGYNLQWAWSSGMTAGRAAATEKRRTI